jgi:isopentenyl diphosphate isomerase/L-lactate dehydrogenase-like FMN-dependent dehydrogenase
MISPTGSSGLLWPSGEMAVARAANAAGTVMVVSAAACLSIETIATTPGPKWLQLMLYRDRGLVREMVNRAHAAGYTALCLTVDCPVIGNRERDIRNGFTIPPRLTIAGITNLLRHLPWLVRMARGPRPGFPNFDRSDGAGLVEMGAYLNTLIDPGMNWDGFRWLRSLWQGPLVIKGITNQDDARQAVELGADGIYVSNHGGRQLDGVSATIECLTLVADAVGDRVPIFVDGGVGRGTDVIKALALGARACLIGRAHLWGLAAGGQYGVARAIEILREEIARSMALGGWRTIDEIDRGAVAWTERIRQIGLHSTRQHPDSLLSG